MWNRFLQIGGGIVLLLLLMAPVKSKFATNPSINNSHKMMLFPKTPATLSSAAEVAESYGWETPSWGGQCWDAISLLLLFMGGFAVNLDLTGAPRSSIMLPPIWKYLFHIFSIWVAWKSKEFKTCFFSGFSRFPELWHPQPCHPQNSAWRFPPIPCPPCTLPRILIENPENPGKIEDLGSRGVGGLFLLQILWKDHIKSSVELFCFILD